MKSQLIAIVAAVLLVGCGESQQPAPAPESQPVEPVAEAAKPTTPPKAVSVNKGADPARGINPEPTTAKAPDISIHKAAEAGNIEAVKKHLAAGADVNATHGGWTPLHYSASAGHKEVAKLLIVEGSDVNAKNDINGGTPLDWATHPANPNHTAEIAAFLRKHGGKTGAELKAEGK